MSVERSAIVMGGGVAGIAAAVRLAEAGIRVTLLETRKRLGGRATSHVDQQTGEPIDNCQHVVLGCCTNILDLYDRLDSLSAIEWQDEMYFADKAGGSWTFTDDPLPAPLHLTRALLGYKGLTLSQRVNVARAMNRMLRTPRSAYESITFADFLQRCRGSQAAIDLFWNPIVRGACNLPVDQVSAASAMQVFQQGFMANRAGWRMGASKIPLSELYNRVPAIVAAAGGQVVHGVGIDALIYADGHVSGVRTKSGDDYHAEAVISALPQDRLLKITPPEVIEADPRLRSLEQIDVSPIIGMHLWLDRPVLDRSHLFFADGRIDWLFVAPDSPQGQQHLHTGISAAQDYVDWKSDDLLAMAMNELRAYSSVLPEAAEAQLVRGMVIRERRATIAPVPGVEVYRPPTVGEGSDLLLAGDWTDTKWPSTMEGAARSGYAAAGAVLDRDLVVADLAPGFLPRLLGRR